MALNHGHVAEAVRYAIEEYDYPKLYQKWLKPVAVLVVDHLVPRVAPGADPKPFMCVNNMTKAGWRKDVRDGLAHTTAYDHECLVDLNVMQGIRDPYTVLMTAESEGYAPAARALAWADADTAVENDMMWDLYKLLQVPSPVRLFFTLSSSKHHDALLRHTSRMVERYTHAGTLRPDDDLWAIQFPTSSLDDTAVMVARWPAGGDRATVQQWRVMARTVEFPAPAP